MQEHQGLLDRLGVDLSALHDLSWDDFVELPEELLRVAELHDGEVVLIATGSPSHQRAIMRIAYALETWVRSPFGSGECFAEATARIDARNGYEPDAVWYATVITDWTQVPDLAVEVLSPSTRLFDERVKVGRYLAAGVREVWLVDTDAHTIRITDGAGGPSVAGVTDTLTSSLLPGFALDLATLWS
jgi:Uma2 family endonuclease